MLDDFDMDFPEEEEEEEDFTIPSDPDEEGGEPSSRNRTFMMVAGALGGLIIIALICVAIWVFVIRPRTGQAAGPDQTATAEAAALAAAQFGTETAEALPPVDTPAPPTNTPTAQLPTNTTVVLPTDTPEDGGGPTPDPRTATVQALLTQAALAQTQAAQDLLTQTAEPSPTVTELPDGGFADDVGIPALIGMAVLLIVVIFIARQLRAATA